MAATTVKSPKKTAFVTEYLEQNPTANHAKVKAAWNEAGYPGSISQTLVSNLRAKLKLTGNTRGATDESNASPEVPVKRGPGRPRLDGSVGKPKTGPESKAKPSAREKLLAEIEADLDHLIFKLMQAGDLSKVEEVLRATRRVVVRSHQG